MVKIWKWYRHYFKEMCIVFFISIILMLTSMVTPLLTRTLIDEGLYEKKWHVILYIIAFLIIIELTVSCLTYLQEKISTKIKSNIECFLNNEVFLHSLKIKYKYYKDYSLIKMLNDVFYDIDEMLSISEDGFVTLFITVFRMIGGSVALFYMNWKLSILVIMIIPIKVFLNYQFKSSTYKCSLELKKNNENYNFWFEDVTKGDVDIRLWNLKDTILDEYKKLNKDNIFTFRKKRLLYKKYNCTINCVEKSAIYFIYIIAAYTMFSGGMSVGEIISFVGFSSYLLSPVDVLLHFAMILKDVEPFMESYQKFMNYDLEDTVKNKALETIDEIVKIKFENVSFSLEEFSILDNLSFEIEKGDKVAFIGENGSGKTSCLNLITRLYEKSAGKILVNDVEIEKIDIENYRNSIGVVCQNVYLFNKTVIENIILDSKSDLGVQVDYFENNNIFKFVNRLPDGWNTRVGSSGSRLSGGEKQKIALGRVINKNPSLIILDEPTSAYDKESVDDFNKWISEEFNDKIVIIVTHDKKVLDFVDKIFEFKDGKITVYNKLG